MAIQLGNLVAEGPFHSVDHLRDNGGVYAVLGNPVNPNQPKVVDVGESGRVQERVRNHDRRQCWERYSSSGWMYAVVYEQSEQRRIQMESDLRRRFDPPCGKR